jgi:hypothetical protein
MCQLVERGRGLPEEPGSSRCDIGVSSQRLPDNVSPELIVNTTLHHPAPLAYSIWNNRSHGKTINSPFGLRLNNPLMCEEAAHQLAGGASNRAGKFPRANDVDPFSRKILGHSTPQFRLSLLTEPMISMIRTPSAMGGFSS